MEKTPAASDPPPPPGLYLTHNAVSEEAWDEIRTWLGVVDSEDPQLLSSGTPSDNYSVTENTKAAQVIPWEPSTREQNRPVAQFGFRYDYVSDQVDTTTNTPPIPAILQRLLLDTIKENNDVSHDRACDSCDDASHKTVRQLLHAQNFTQCIINVYRASTSSHIPWHTDAVAFGPVILVFCFGETRPLHLRRRRWRPVEESNQREEEGNDEYDYYTAYPRHLSRYILTKDVREHWEHSVPAGQGWRISITFRSLRQQQDDS